MESREKCEQIISMFNNRPLTGLGPTVSSQPLVVKFADGGSSRRKTAVSSPDTTWSGQASTDGSVSEDTCIDNIVMLSSWTLFQENALSPDNRHSNGSAIGPGFGYNGAGGQRMGGPSYYPSRLMSPGSATGPPLMAGAGAGWLPTSSASYIIQSPTGPPMNPNEPVFQLSPISVDPYTGLVSGMHGLSLGGPGQPAPAAGQFIPAAGGQLGYVIGPGGYASLPNLEAQQASSTSSPVQQQQIEPSDQDRGQSNWDNGMNG